MDAKLNGEVQGSAGFPVWDLNVDTNLMIVPMITDGEEDQQQANVAASLIVGSIPQVPSAGTDWLGFMAETTTFPAIDAQIRGMMKNAGHPDYFPTYDLLNSQLSVVATKNQGAV